jgi:crotonobetainyl-CoA:carnitine CoA-transferase CaiB-like acyl-CoA transferase
MWTKLCDHLDMSWMLDDPRFATGSARLANRTELERLLNERFKLRRRDEWIAELRALGMPAGPVYDMGEVFADPQVVATKMVETIEHPSIGELRQLASPLGLECLEGGSVRHPPPRLGEHTREVLEEIGFPRARIDELVSRGVIAGPLAA